MKLFVARLSSQHALEIPSSLFEILKVVSRCAPAAEAFLVCWVHLEGLVRVCERLLIAFQLDECLSAVRQSEHAELLWLVDLFGGGVVVDGVDAFCVALDGVSVLKRHEVRVSLVLELFRQRQLLTKTALHHYLGVRRRAARQLHHLRCVLWGILFELDRRYFVVAVPFLVCHLRNLVPRLVVVWQGRVVAFDLAKQLFIGTLLRRDGLCQGVLDVYLVPDRRERCWLRLLLALDLLLGVHGR